MEPSSSSPSSSLPFNSTPPMKRQRIATMSSTVNNVTQAGPVVSLLSVPLSILFQLQPQIMSITTPSKTKDKPLLSKAEAQALLQVHYCAQDMDALIVTAETAFRQKLKHLEYEQSICGNDHPMTRSLVPLLRYHDSYSSLQHVPTELNNGILSKLERMAISLEQFAEMNATTADNLADIAGMEPLVEGKHKLSQIQLELSKRIMALLSHQITEETDWCSMETYCHQLFPNQTMSSKKQDQTKEQRQEIRSTASSTKAKRSSQVVHSLTSATTATLDDTRMVDSGIDQMEELATKQTEQEQEATTHVSTPTVETTLGHETNLGQQENVSGFSILNQAIHVQDQSPIDTTGPNVAARKTGADDDDVMVMDKENSQSQYSQNDSSLHPTLLIYGSQVSHTSSNRSSSLLCRPGTETQTAAALLNHFAIAKTKDSSPDVNVETNGEHPL